jgi:sulfur-oxidizing protein SoxA
MTRTSTFLRDLGCASTLCLVVIAFNTRASHAADQRKSGFDFMRPATQALQKDDTQNPAMLWVKDGEVLWQKAEGRAGKSCASCHGDARTSMRAVAARYPAFSRALDRPMNLQQQINYCRATNQQAEPLPAEHRTLLSLESYVALQSRGSKITTPDASKLLAARARGDALFRQRIGQISLSCKDCHDDNAGKNLAGSVIPEAHPTGYPLYRLEWEGVGSLQRRLRNCMTALRAEPFAYGSEELTAMEVFLASRAAGMVVESPAVRP